MRDGSLVRWRTSDASYLNRLRARAFQPPFDYDMKPHGFEASLGATPWALDFQVHFPDRYHLIAEDYSQESRDSHLYEIVTGWSNPMR